MYVVLHDVHWGDVSDAMHEADYALLALATCFLLLSILLRALRWRVLMQPIDGVGVGRLFGLLNVAYFVNNLVPLAMGDIARAYLVSELGSISTTRALSTVVVERVMDVLTLLIM